MLDLHEAKTLGQRVSLVSKFRLNFLSLEQPAEAKSPPVRKWTTVQMDWPLALLFLEQTGMSKRCTYTAWPRRPRTPV